MWQAYALPGILYGSEIVMWDDSNMKKLDIIQNNLIENVLRLPQYVATVGLEILSKITPVWWYIMRRKISYLQTILSLPDTHWAKICYYQQLHWAQQDNICSGELHNLQKTNGKRNY